MWLLEDLTAMANAAANEDDFFSDVEVVLPLSPAGPTSTFFSQIIATTNRATIHSYHN
jgi:hypothetical protein